MTCNIGSYEQRCEGFDWSFAPKELGYKESSPLNIGYYCTDRICQQGLGKKLALIWEGFSGEVER